MVLTAAARESQGEHSTCHHEGGKPPQQPEVWRALPVIIHSFMVHIAATCPALFQCLTCKSGPDDTAPAPPTQLRQDTESEQALWMQCTRTKACKDAASLTAHKAPLRTWELGCGSSIWLRRQILTRFGKSTYSISTLLTTLSSTHGCHNTRPHLTFKIPSGLTLQHYGVIPQASSHSPLSHLNYFLGHFSWNQQDNTRIEKKYCFQKF